MFSHTESWDVLEMFWSMWESATFTQDFSQRSSTQPPPKISRTSSYDTVYESANILVQSLCEWARVCAQSLWETRFYSFCWPVCCFLFAPSCFWIDAFGNYINKIRSLNCFSPHVKEMQGFPQRHFRIMYHLLRRVDSCSPASPNLHF